MSWVSYWIHLLCWHIIYWLEMTDYCLEMSLGTVLVLLHWFLYLLLDWDFHSCSSIVVVIFNRYGTNLFKNVRKLEKVDYKYCKLQLDLDFLQTCQCGNVIPKFLQFNLAIETYDSLRLTTTARKGSSKKKSISRRTRSNSIC